ncbi:MAG: 2-phospho-L-lactate guanylyltransferase [Acidimicrobiia bacterium]|nr:2-phospho-L-lactate guanylyltransferase [Acidimicrobiia bacterium]
MLVALPLKAFGAAKGRLDGILSPPARAALSRAVAERVAAACAAAGAAVAVVASDRGVASWAGSRGLEVIAEPPGGGLNGAATAAAATARRHDRAWCVVHADLPFLTPSNVASVLGAMGPGRVVLAPSRNGGTNLLAAAVPLHFAYGPRSFSHHLAAARHLERRVVVALGTALDLDTPEDLRAAAALPGGEWLREYLT